MRKREIWGNSYLVGLHDILYHPKLQILARQQKAALRGRRGIICKPDKLWD